MHSEYTAVIKQEDDCWVGWIEEIPGVNCQEETREKLMETLSVTLKEALEFTRHSEIKDILEKKFAKTLALSRAID